MIVARPARDRGRTQLDWLDSRHTFSFAGYYDPRFLGFQDLRVINEDRVKPGRGFDTHFHRDMEILTYLLEGKLQHRDNLGNGSVILPGDVQRMTAGTGVLHSEFNPSGKDPVHFYQIWIYPAERGLPPEYEQKSIDPAPGTLRRIASREGKDGGVRIHQDASVYAARLPKGKEVRHPLDPSRHAWVQVARGAVTLNGTPLGAGDGAAVTREGELALAAADDSELLLFDLA